MRSRPSSSPLFPLVLDQTDDRPGAAVAGPRRAADQEAIARVAGDENALARLVLEHIPGTFVTIMDTELRLVSVATDTFVGDTPASSFVGQRLFDLLPAEQAAVLEPEYRAALTGEVRTLRFEQAETAKTFDLTAGPLRDGDDRIVGIIVVGQDATQQAYAERRLATQFERFAAAFDTAPLPMVVLNADGSVRMVNRKLCDLTGRPRARIVGRGLPELFDPRDRDRFGTVLPSLLSGERSGATIEARMVIPGEPPVTCSLHVTGRSPDDPESGITVHIVDRTEQNRHDAQLRYLAGHDTLTGLLNRARFEDALESHLDNCARYGHDGAVVLVDIDHFKQINDVHGRAVGDAQLVEMAGLVQRDLPGDAVVARLEGDTFAVLLASGGLIDAVAAAEAIRGAAGDHARISQAAGRVAFTLSLGVAAFSPEVAAPADALVLAEHAVTIAKADGRDRVGVPELVARPGERRSQTAIGRLRRAIRDERFELHAQPIRQLADDHVTQYELLVRMRDERGSLVLPDTFLPLAEHYGLIGEIDAWVARRGAAVLADVGGDLAFHVNISGQSLGHPALLDAITGGLREHPVAPGRFVFELTETAAIENMTQALTFAETLRDLGCELALDDFGAGYGGFHLLKHLPFGYLKIDGEFIADIAASPGDAVIVDGILAITRGLGVRTIAEFVGDDACAAMLREKGVDLAQGFHLGRPRPLDELLSELAATRSQGA